jgi:hypothetical protein
MPIATFQSYLPLLTSNAMTANNWLSIKDFGIHYDSLKQLIFSHWIAPFVVLCLVLQGLSSPYTHG